MGGDLFDWILDRGTYTEMDAREVVKQVLQTISYLHSLNIVHRNIKLENLMYYRLDSHCKVVIGDFHLARIEMGPISDPCGTPEYLAPEVVARHKYSRPVDCWAVGVVMYILLSGNPPFYDESEGDEEGGESHNRAIFRKILAGELEFDSLYWQDISGAARELVCRLLEVDPDHRATASEALEHAWVSGHAALGKNLKEGVCTRIERNFAKAKWKKAIRATTLMQRLRAAEPGPERSQLAESAPGGREGEPRVGDERAPPLQSAQEQEDPTDCQPQPNRKCS